MFSYCGNNPVSRSDASGQLWQLFRTVYALMTRILMKRNYTHNSKVDADPFTTTHNRILNDQNGDTGDNFEYGGASVQHGGCGAIAIHNVKVLAGMESTLSETIKDCQDAGAMLVSGFLGTAPWKIDTVLEGYGINSTPVGLNEITSPGTYVISYFHSRGAHTVVVVFDGDSYTTYNRYGNGKLFYNPPETFASNYICGYYLGR